MNQRPLALSDFDAVLRETANLQSNGYDRAGNWSLGQVCTHLALAIESSLDGFARLNATFVDRSLLELVFKKQRMRTGVPMPEGLAPEAADDAAGVGRLQAAIDRLRTHRGDMRPHPYFGPIMRDEWLQFHLIHCSHHLGFLLPRGAA